MPQMVGHIERRESSRSCVTFSLLALPYGQFRLSYLPVFQGGERVGWATGASYSPNLRRMISLGRLRKDLAVAGTELTVRWGGFSDEPTADIRATVSDLPFIGQHRRDELVKP